MSKATKKLTPEPKRRIVRIGGRRYAKYGKWYELDPKKHGIGGLTPRMPKPRKQDRRALPWEGFAVVFFPQYDVGFKAEIHFMGCENTMSQTPEAARVRFADSIGGNEHPAKKWREYHKAGHRVRRVRIIDLGPA